MDSTARDSDALESHNENENERNHSQPHSHTHSHNQLSRKSLIQTVVLVLLVAQTTSSCTLVSYSKSVLKEKYNPLEAVMFTELVKMVVSGE